MSLKKCILSLFLFVNGVWAIDICAQTLNVMPKLNTTKPGSDVYFDIWTENGMALGLYGQSAFRDADMGGYFGVEYSAFYFECYMAGSLKKTEPVAFLDIEDPYSSLSFGVNTGLALDLDCTCKFLPYIGFGLNLASPPSDNLEEEDNEYTGSAFVMNAGLRVSYLFDCFEVFIAPEYRLTLAENDNMPILRQSSETISSWGKGFRINVGIGLFVFGF